MQVRAIIGDTLPGDPQLQDEEIAYFLTQNGLPMGAAALCCQRLATQYSRSVTRAAGDTKIQYSDMAKAYRLQAAQLLQMIAASGAVPYAGGISLADKSNRENDSDRVTGSFSIGMDDNFLPVSPSGNETDTMTGAENP